MSILIQDPNSHENNQISSIQTENIFFFHKFNIHTNPVQPIYTISISDATLKVGLDLFIGNLLWLNDDLLKNRLHQHSRIWRDLHVCFYDLFCIIIGYTLELDF